MTFVQIDVTWWIALILVFDLTVRIWAVIVVPRNRRPTAGMAWLLAIFFLPLFGLLLFLLIGTPRLPRKFRRKQAAINEVIHDTSENLRFGTLRPNPPEWFNSLVALNRNLGAMPLTGDNEAHLISDYDGSIREMARSIDAAKTYVHVEFYILQLDETTEPFFQALDDACARGVRVRVLLDHWANFRKPRYAATKARLDAMGALWHLMLPVQPLKGRYQRPDLRNHRKLLVIDGDIAYMGSQNVTDSSYNLKKNIRRGLHWVDLMVRLEGPVVSSVNAVFLTDWYTETDETLGDETDIFDTSSGPGDLDCQVVPSGPGFESENNLRLFLGLIYAAQRKVMIVSPYFVPDESLLIAVTTARQRGAEVELFVSEEGDQALVYHAQRSYYEVLLRAGVRIWLYPKPYILHSKSLTIDDEVAVIGSSNMDMRSFGLNMEVSLLIRGEEFVEEVREIEDEYRQLSRELTIDEWKKQPLRSRVLDNLARLTSALQ